MDFYVIPPNSNLELMHCGDRYFCLAQLYLKDESYRQFFKSLSKDKWVTLDNGAGDHNLVTEDVLIEVANDLMPNEIIPPDVLFNSQQTIDNYWSFMQKFRQNKNLDLTQIFFCPQGEDREAWLKCYDFALQQDDITTIGFSKIAIPYAFNQVKGDLLIMESRHECYDLLKSQGLIAKNIHCLGAGDPREFIHYKGDPLMRSTDSCFSVWAAMNGIRWSANNFERIKTPQDYFDRSVGVDQVSIALSNIEYLRQCV